MKTSGLYTRSRHTCHLKTLNDAVIVPIGDLHGWAWNHSDHTFNLFQRWYSRRKRDGLTMTALGMGDYGDWFSTSERENVYHGKLHSTNEDKNYARLKCECEQLAERLGFMSGDFMGVLEGNHQGYVRNGLSTDEYLAKLLKCRFLGVEADINLTFRYKDYKPKTFRIRAHHGSGGGCGTTLGASLNSLQRTAQTLDNFDFVFMGHDHKKVAGKFTKIGAGSDGLYDRDMVLMRTGGFQIGRESGHCSHVSDSGMAPTSLGWGHVRIEWDKSSKKCLEPELIWACI